jgi:magnesium-transporting ATPase (P-type)
LSKRGTIRLLNLNKKKEHKMERERNGNNMDCTTKFTIWYWAIGTTLAVIVSTYATFCAWGMPEENAAIIMSNVLAYFTMGAFVLCAIALLVALLYMRKHKQPTDVIKPK